jgi:gp16 family phage-associated protein
MRNTNRQGGAGMTAEQVKQQFRANGTTFTEWALEHGFDRNDVYRVLNGQLKGNYGKGHEIAVLLGMKPDPALDRKAA